MKSIIALVVILAVVGCASQSYTTGTKQLSRELVDQRLIKDKTTKTEVIALLGEPQSTTSGNMGLNLPGVPAKTWTYTKTFHRDAQEKGFGYAVAQGMMNPYGSGYDRIEVSVVIVMFDAHGR